MRGGRESRWSRAVRSAPTAAGPPLPLVRCLARTHARCRHARFRRAAAGRSAARVHVERADQPAAKPSRPASDNESCTRTPSVASRGTTPRHPPHRHRLRGGGSRRHSNIFWLSGPCGVPACKPTRRSSWFRKPQSRSVSLQLAPSGRKRTNFSTDLSGFVDGHHAAPNLSERLKGHTTQAIGVPAPASATRQN